jgi:hypothetical protein
MTAVEWLQERFYFTQGQLIDIDFDQAKEMEKQNTDNKIIHFAEWLTKKHTLTLMTLYEQFEEQYYNETFNLSQQDKP